MTMEAGIVQPSRRLQLLVEAASAAQQTAGRLRELAKSLPWADEMRRSCLAVVDVAFAELLGGYLEQVDDLQLDPEFPLSWNNRHAVVRCRPT